MVPKSRTAVQVSAQGSGQWGWERGQGSKRETLRQTPPRHPRRLSWTNSVAALALGLLVDLAALEQTDSVHGLALHVKEPNHDFQPEQ